MHRPAMHSPHSILHGVAVWATAKALARCLCWICCAHEGDGKCLRA